MTRYASLALVLASAALLVGCTPGTPDPTPTASASGTPSSPTASASPTPTPSSTPAPADPLALSCDEILSPEQVAALLGPGAVSQGDTTSNGGGRASTEPEILALMPAAARHCTWTIPDTEAGMIVSILRADAGVRAAVDGVTPLFTRDPQAGVRYLTFGSMDGFIFTETHALGEGATDLWVAAFTSASNSREIAQVVWNSLVAP